MTLSTSSLTHQKWKKGLAMLSKWSPKDKKLLATSPTVLAAATEKVIRHSKTTTTLSRPLKSEDLTASQFASYAGIKIQHETDQDDDDVEENDDSDDDEADDIVVPNNATTMYMSSVPVIVPLARSCSDRGGSHRKSTGPQIWDSEFWQHESIRKPSNATITTATTRAKQQPQHPTSIMMAPAQSYASTTSTTSTYSAYSDCSTSTTGHHQNNNDVPQLVRSHPSVIHKGRFKIVLGHEEEEHEENQQQQQQPPCVEWRRKRSCTQ